MVLVIEALETTKMWEGLVEVAIVVLMMVWKRGTGNGTSNNNGSSNSEATGLGSRGRGNVVEVIALLCLVVADIIVMMVVPKLVTMVMTTKQQVFGITWHGFGVGWPFPTPPSKSENSMKLLQTQVKV